MQLALRDLGDTSRRALKRIGWVLGCQQIRRSVEAGAVKQNMVNANGDFVSRFQFLSLDTSSIDIGSHTALHVENLIACTACNDSMRFGNASMGQPDVCGSRSSNHSFRFRLKRECENRFLRSKKHSDRNVRKAGWHNPQSIIRFDQLFARAILADDSRAILMQGKGQMEERVVPHWQDMVICFAAADLKLRSAIPCTVFNSILYTHPYQVKWYSMFRVQLHSCIYPSRRSEQTLFG